MFNNGRKTIGLFVCKLPAYYQRVICRVVADEFEKMGYNLAVFSTFGMYDNDEEFIKGECNLLSIPSFKDFAGIILCLDVFDDAGMVNQLLKRINEEADCPVVSIRQKQDEYISILSDDGDAISDMINHVIDEHGANRIYYLSGPENMYDIFCREEAYFATMKKRGLACPQEYVYRGNLWKNMGKEAVDYFLSLSSELPNAIICANDYMAIAICEELNRRNISVPSDVIVTGFDDIVEAAEICPSITTVQVLPELFAHKAVEAMQLAMEDNLSYGKKGTIHYIKSRVVLRESCGCEKDDNKGTLFRKISEKKERLIHLQKQNTFMVFRMEGISQYDQLPDMIGRYIGENKGVKSFFLCLNKDYSFENRSDGAPFTDEMDVYIQAIFPKNQQVQVKMPHMIFSRGSLLPTASSEPMVYYFNPLHHKEHCFGYAAIAFENNAYPEDGDYSFYLPFVVNIDNMLENIFIQNKLNRLMEEKLYLMKHDIVTGVYNTYSFYNEVSQWIEQSAKKSETISFVCVHIANYEKIISELGLIQSDDIMRCIAEYITRNNVCPNLVVGRLLKDEFCVVMQNYDEECLVKWVRNIEQRVAELNLQGKFPCSVEINIGYYIKTPQMDIGIEEGIKNTRLRMNISNRSGHSHVYEKYVDEAIVYIKQNYWKKISIENLAGNLGITRAYLTSCFKTRYHITVQKYIQDYRLFQACTYLENEEMSIKDIAFHCGFTDELYFSKAFKKKFGKSPKKYRAEKGE